MPDETRAIEPALSNVQWQRRMVQGLDVSDGDKGFSIMLHSNGVIIADSWAAHSQDANYIHLHDPAKIVALMAIANAALPDDDPRKITYADVVLLLEHAAALLDDDDRPQVAAAESLRALAMKLESLLPPDVTTYTLARPPA